MADNGLNRARRGLIASTDQLLGTLDPNRLGDSFREIAPALAATRAKARETTLDFITSRASKTVAEQVGVDLGWEFLDRSKWIGPEVNALYSQRLSGVADWLITQQAAGRDPQELTIWTKYWQHQVAGSDVDKVARAATVDMVGNTPVLGRMMRVAEPKACAWCRGLATRGAVYYTRDTALASGHAHCRCEVVEVTNDARIAYTREVGYESWEKSSLSGEANPFPQKGGSLRPPGGGPALRRPDPELFRPGAQTPERRVAIEAQLASYQQSIEQGKGSDWMRTRMIDLADELDELDRLGIGIAQPSAELSKLPQWHQSVKDAAARLPRDRSMIGKQADGSLDKIDAKVFRSRDVVPAPGPVAVEHVNAILDAGRALDEELEQRIQARLAVDPAEVDKARKAVDKAWDKAWDAYMEAFDELPPEFASSLDRNQLTDVHKIQLRVKWKAARGLKATDPDPFSEYEAAKKAFLEATSELGSNRYNDVVREEALKLLQEVRDMGNGTPLNYKASIGKVDEKAMALQAMRNAESVYPSAWTDTVSQKYESISLLRKSRGYNSGGNTIALSMKRVQLTGGTPMDDVATHELGHTMEHAIPGLRTTEWIYHWMRSVPGYDPAVTPVRPSKVSIYGSSKEVAIADEWRELYSGKFYSKNGYRAERDSYEIFTTGIESLMTGSPYFNGRSWDKLSELGTDREFRSYILGVLSVL